jgi:RNA polymerase sigma-70 factor (ECF subfamily)
VSLATDSPQLPLEEHGLIRGAQEGDRRAFAALVERYWERLYRWLYHLTRDRHTAEDLAQETFLKALGHLDSFRAGTNFGAWLFRIAHNAWVNHARAAARDRQPVPDNLPGREEDPAEQALAKESMQLLARAVGRLPAEFRAAFLLRAEEGLSFRQIAEVLGLTEETARWRVFKARQKLLSVLAPQLEREER